MPHWILYGTLAVHAILFAVVSVSAEWRRPGLIQLGFALLYLGLGFVNMDLIAYDGALHKMLFLYLDFLGAALIFTLCYPGKDNRIFTPDRWLALTGVLIVFQVTQYLNYRHAEGLPVSVDATTYEVLVLVWAACQIFINTPGIRDGYRELKGLVAQKHLSVSYDGRRSRASNSRHAQPGINTGSQSGHRGGGLVHNAMLLVHSRMDRTKAEEKR